MGRHIEINKGGLIVHEPIACNLIQAWLLWAQGQLKPTDTLFHIPIMWWGRIGGIADFFASLLLLINTQWLSAWVREWETAVLTKPNMYDDPPRVPFGGKFVYGVLVFAPAIALLAYDELASGAYSIILETWTSRYCGVRAICRGTIVILGGELFICVSMAIGHFGLFRSIVWIAKHPEFRSLLRAVAVALLVLGFHFLLLGA